MILLTFFAGEPKQNRYTVKANGNEYFISIRSGPKAVAYSPFKGKLKERIKGDKIDVRIFPIKPGDLVTIEIFKNGKLCTWEYNWPPSGEGNVLDLECD